jgi:hypothetical protein
VRRQLVLGAWPRCPMLDLIGPVSKEPEFPFTLGDPVSPIGIERMALFITRELHT